MPRKPRIVIPSELHHVSQYGNYNQAVFDDTEDVCFYCESMNRYAAIYGLEIYAFCLMDTHVHFLAVPPDSTALARTFNTVHMQYAQYRNRKHKVRGHLWQGRFLSCVIEQTFADQTMRYIERNPVRSGLVALPWLYKWSSARAHSDKGIAPITLHHASFSPPDYWIDFLNNDDKDMHEEIRLKTRRGLAVGSETFIHRLEQECNRSFAALNPGRPRKNPLHQTITS